MGSFDFLDTIFPDLPPPPPPFIAATDGNSVAFAFHRLPQKITRRHFLLLGKPDSGKTVLINLYLQSIAPRLRRDGPQKSRAVVFDAKGDMPQVLAGMNLTPETANIYDLNPFRSGALHWNIAEDIISPGNALQLAITLIPPEPNASAPFFAQSAQNCLRAAVLALMETAPRQWTLRDLLLSLRSRERLEALISQSPEAKGLANNHLQDKRHRDAIMSTLHARLAALDVLAALWATTPKERTFSVSRFFKEPGIIILGHDDRYEGVLDPQKTLLLNFLSQRLLASSEPEVAHAAGPHTWLVLDEFRGLNDDGTIARLLNRGRSKGVSVLMGIQSIEGIYAKFKKFNLGQDAADELLNMCGSIGVLRVSEPTAKWAERHFGSRRIWEESYGRSFSQNGNSSSVNTGLQERSLFTASTFTSIAPLSSGQFQVFTDVDGAVVVKNRSTAAVFSATSKPDMRFSARERSIKDQILTEWSAAEEKFWCPRVVSGGQPQGVAPSKPFTFRPSYPKS